VRRTWRGGEMLSNVRRANLEIDALAKHGSAIAVLELEGSLFFGTADALVEGVDAALARGAELVVIDLQRITSLDSTGAFALLRAQQRCKEAGRALLLSSTRSRGLDRALLRSMGVLTPEQEALSFHDLSSALAHAEDRLLDRVLRTSRYGESIALGDFDALSALSAAELTELASYLKAEEFADGALVCRQTEPGDRVHFIERGRALVSFRPSHQQEDVPLGTLCPGTMFGEMSILDRGPRSASVRAEGALRCQVLHLADFERLSAERPALALALLRGIGRELSSRIRTANRLASVLRD
jgi:SulP family sulfate permease